MKPILWSCIMILSSAIVLILYSDYNTRVTDFLCTTVHYCNNHQETDTINQNKEDEDIIGTEDVIYTIGTQLYEVSFDLSNPVQQKLFEDYSTSNSTCELNGSFDIGGGPGCSNITGFTHTYTYPKLGVSLIAYGGIVGTQDLVDNPGLFSPYLENPFVLMNNTISYSWQQGSTLETESIIYREFGEGETMDSVIEEAKNKKIDGMSYYTSTEYEPQSIEGFKDTDYILHSINYRDFKNNKDRNNFYIFKPGKNYYYIIDRQGEETCIPTACGLASHEITYFAK